jgi:hypothetical protein
MAAIEVSSSEFKRRLTDVQRAEVDQHLASGRGVACYASNRGAPMVVMTYGTRDADVPGYPPANYGGGSLSTYVPAPKSATPRRSPLLDYEPPRQIARPRVSPAFTETPQVTINMRTSAHPRGNAEYISPSTPRSPVEAEPVQPPQVSEEQAWWAARL